jgi:RNA polymerase sigma-70 factor (ECF subfamily)
MAYPLLAFIGERSRLVAVFIPAFDDREPSEQSRDVFYKVILPLRLELFRMALKMTNHKHDAEDLLHDSFLKALSRIESLADEGSARAWMYSILRNTFISGLRSQDRVKLEPVPGNEIHEIIDLIAHCNGTATKVDVTRAMERLEEPFREPIVLCDVFGYTYAEAAKEIGCPLGTLMSRLSRGREKLREILEA